MKKEIKNFEQPSIEDALKGSFKIEMIDEKKEKEKSVIYSQKLKHPKWQKKRLEIMQRDNFECKCCFSKEKELHVHHFNYSTEPWGVEDFELITLCLDCHSMYHGIFDKFDKSLIANMSDLYWYFVKKMNNKSKST